MPEKLQSLESFAFPTQVDREVLQEWFNRHNDIKPEFVERNEITGNKSYELQHIEGEKYNLKIAKNIKNKELPSIIYRINQITFGDEMPEYASSKELGRKILFVIDTLLEKDLKLKDDKKEISKYIRLYAQLFGKEAVNKISNKNERDEILGKNEQKRFNKFKEKIKILENTSNLLEELENEVAQNVKQHLDEAVFEDGVNKLDTIKTMTQDEVRNLRNKKKTGEIQDEEIDIKNFMLRSYDKAERELREKIGIDTLKQKLNKARGKGKKYAIENIELNAANTILEHLYQYPWQTTNDYGSFPKDIIDHKEIHCTGFSAIGRRFLLELGIEHKALNIPDHSSLEISIGGEIYYFDAATYGKIYRFHYGRKVGDFRKIEFYDEEKTPINTYAILGNAEIIIQSQMLSNLGHILFIKGETKKAIEMYRKAININPKNISAMNNLSNALIEEGLLDEAANILKKAIELYSRLPHLWGNLGRVFIKKGKYEEATSLFKKAINLKNSPQYHYWLGEALDKQGKTDESIKAFQESIILKDNMPILYERLGNILIKAGYEESGNLFLFVYNIMRQKGKRYQNQKLTIQEEKILQLVQKKKLWSLRRLLFSQIKKEMRIVAKENKKRKG